MVQSPKDLRVACCLLKYMNTYLEHPEPEIRLELLPSDLGDMKKKHLTSPPVEHPDGQVAAKSDLICLERQ